MPLIIAADNFNRANGTTGANWTPIGTQRNIDSNAWSDIGIGGADAIEYYNAATFPEDQYAQITMKSYSSTHLDECGPGLSLRVSGTSMANVSGYWAVWDDTATNNITIARWTSGSYAQLVQFSSAVAVNDVLRFEVEGAVLRFYKNGTLVGSHTDPSPISGGKPGTATSNGGKQGTMDDWEGGYVSRWKLEQSAARADLNAGLAFPNNVKSGSLIVVAIEQDGTFAITAPVDTLGTLFAECYTQPVSGNNQRIGMWAGITGSAGANTVTPTDISTFDAIAIAEYSFSSGNGLKRNSNTIEDTSIPAGSNASAGTTSPANDNLLIMQVGPDTGVATTWSAGPDGYLVSSAALSGDANDTLVMQHKRVNSGSASGTWIITGSTTGGLLADVVFGNTDTVEEGPPFIIPFRVY